MPNASERIAALEALVADLDDLRRDSVPDALAALAEGQASIAAALRDTTAAAHAEAQPDAQ